MSKVIPLTRGKEALVDDEDYPYLSQYRWCFGLNGYATRHDLSGDSNKELMHRMIMNTPQGMRTDHINGNKLDNRRSNLRVCTQAENMRNAPVRSTNTSGFKGVSWKKYAKRWSASITVNGKSIHLGYFKDKEEAARQYDLAALKYFGVFASTNFPSVNLDELSSFVRRDNL